MFREQRQLLILSSFTSWTWFSAPSQRMTKVYEDPMWLHYPAVMPKDAYSFHILCGKRWNRGRPQQSMPKQSIILCQMTSYAGGSSHPALRALGSWLLDRMPPKHGGIWTPTFLSLPPNKLWVRMFVLISINESHASPIEFQGRRCDPNSVGYKNYSQAWGYRMWLLSSIFP